MNQDTLNTTQLKLASDYYNASEMSVKFKKVKVYFLYFKYLNIYLKLNFNFCFQKKKFRINPLTADKLEKSLRLANNKAEDNDDLDDIDNVLQGFF